MKPTGDNRAGSLMSPIVVGVDGSPDSYAALVWAAGIAGAEGVVHAVRTLSGSDQTSGASMSDPAHVEEFLRKFEGELADTAKLENLRAQINCHLFEGNIADGLVEIATVMRAPLIAVGSHGRSLRRSKMVGGVVHRLLHDADIPVAVVRSDHDPHPKAPGHVIVGVGDGPATVAALHWSASLASRQGLALRLVHGATPEHRPVFDLERAMRKALEKVALLVDPDELLRWVEEDLAALVDELHSRSGNSELSITTVAKLGPAGPLLVAEAEASAANGPVMIVMGKHFDGPVTGYFTTATLHHVLTHASCPVIIVPQHSSAD